MAKQSRKQAKATRGSTKRALRALEERLDALEAESRTLAKRLRKVTKATRRLEALPFPGPSFPGRRHPKGRPPGPPWGPPPWARRPARGTGPVVSLEVPLETDDPAAPLWATVAARLPEEITAVGDDGRLVRYRYSPVGSTPQAPRYRRLAGPDEGNPAPTPSPGPAT